MKIFAYILLIFVILGTVGIAVKQPQMHTKVLIYDSQYTIIDENSESKPVEVVVEEKDMPTMPVENTLTKEQIVFENQVQPEVNQTVKKVEQPKTEVKTSKNQVQTKTEPKTTVNKNPVVQTTKTPSTSTVSQTTKPVNTVSYPSVPTTQTVVQKTSEPKTVKILTAQEEEIAWNIWRSNLQNQLLKDCKLPVVPMGTVFKVSFDVDKNGRVSNVQTWSTDSRYTPYAIEFIAPVIRSYQGKPILDFPEGSQRTKTTFTGGWKISQTAKYSNPSDYHDIEKVVK